RAVDRRAGLRGARHQHSDGAAAVGRAAGHRDHPSHHHPRPPGRHGCDAAADQGAAWQGRLHRRRPRRPRRCAVHRPHGRRRRDQRRHAHPGRRPQRLAAQPASRDVGRHLRRGEDCAARVLRGPAWRLGVLSHRERTDLTPKPSGESTVDCIDASILDCLASDARESAASVAAQTGLPESTVRRRIGALARSGSLRTQVLFDPRRAGLAVDANLWIQVEPSRLDHVGRTMAVHPAVHGCVATTGQSNLQVAIWIRDLDELYRLVTRELGVLGVTAVDTVLVGRAVKRPETPWLPPVRSPR
ncbi:LOW QUALITY PROTEIN: AsnC-family transcriptional regulator, partial [Kutzneria sp. 744]